MRDRASAGRRATAAVMLLFGSLPVLGATPVAAQEAVALTAQLNGVNVARTSNGSPIRLDPEVPADLTLTVANRGDAPITVRTLRLEGRVVGLAFFAYESSTLMEVAPGATDARRFALDLRGLGGQATGLMPGSLQLLDDDRAQVASQPLIVDVRGSLWSLYGLFGLLVAILTGMAFVGAVTALARNRLQPNRFLRGLRFAPIGVGVGLMAVFTVSVLRIWAAERSVTLVIVGIATTIAFVMGYFTPTPEDELDDDELPAEPEPVGQRGRLPQ